METTMFSRGGGRPNGAWYVLPLLLLLTAMPWARAGETDLTGPGGSTDMSMQNAINAINTNAGAGNNFDLTIKENSPTTGTTVDNAVWSIHGMPAPDDYSGVDATGFANITVKGNTGDRQLTGNGANGGTVLRIMNVRPTSTINVSNLKISGGGINRADVFDISGLVGRNEFGGGGLMLGANGGLGNAASYAAGTIGVSSVDVENNAIVLTSAVNTRNVYGGGIYVSGVGGGAAANPANGHSKVTFTNVNLRNNSITYTNGSADDASIRGGGARIAFADKFEYNGGEVKGNSIHFTNGVTGNHASGGGLSVDTYGIAPTGNVDIKSVQFTENTVTMSGSGGMARGGGFYYLGSNTTINPITVSFDANTEFTLNQAIGAGSNVEAYGGAAYIALNDANASFKSTKFTSNKAVSPDGMAGGGAIYVGTLYTAAQAKGNLTVEGARFQGNEADGSIAFGGAVLAEAGTGHKLTGSEFVSNTAKGVWEAGGGAIGIYFNGDVTLTGSTFERNFAKATGGGGLAEGGAVALGIGAHNLAGAKFDSNSAEALGSSGSAVGGALFIRGGSADLTGASFTKNTVQGDASGLGGAIYLMSGSLKLEDATLTNNLATATSNANAQGGAIFVNTTTTNDSTINLSATSDKETIISGNRAGGYASGIHFGIDPLLGTQSNSSGFLNISGAGKVSLLDPVTVDMNKNQNFTMTKTDSGTLAWGGTNVFKVVGGTATVDIESGSIQLTDSFTARGEDGGTMNPGHYEVKIGKDVNIEFSISRDQKTAMFDFKNNGNTRFIVQPGATLTTNVGREIISNTWKFAIASGADLDDLNEARDNFTFVQEGNLTNILGLSVDGDTLYASVRFDSPFDQSGVNPKSAQTALDRVIKGMGDKMTDAEYLAILGNPYGVTPELYVDQAMIMVNATGMVARTAMEFGARQPHRMRLRMQNAPMTASYEEYEVYEEVEEVYESRDSYNSYGSSYGSGGYRSYDAYPSLATCTNDSGLRLWAGYVGDYDRRDSHGGYQGYKVERHGFVIGLNYDVGLRGTIGVYGGYTNADSESRLSDQKNKADTGHAGVIARFSPLLCSPELSIYADGGYHFAYNDLDRKLGDYQASSSYDQDVWTVGLGAEYVWMRGNNIITPYAEGRFIHLSQDALREHGSSATTTNTDAIRENYFHTRVGIEFSHDFQMACGMITPSVNVAWRHEFGDNYAKVGATYINDPMGMPYWLTSASMERDSADIGVSLKTLYQLGSGNMLGFNLSYNLNLSRRSNTHSFYAGIDVGF